MAVRKLEARTWTVEEAHRQFDELLEAAAERGPQEIAGRGRRFRLTAIELSASPRGRELLSRGGPLEDGDDLA